MSNLAQPGLQQVRLDDRYTGIGRVYLSGTQALIRLPMLQRERDLASGLNTAGFISGYRGSPLGPLDQGLWKAREHLAAHHITFQPGLNEDMAATTVWGSQQVRLFPGARYDGVFGLWYGKGPGVDRMGRHAGAPDLSVGDHLHQGQGHEPDRGGQCQQEVQGSDGIRFSYRQDILRGNYPGHPEGQVNQVEGVETMSMVQASHTGAQMSEAWSRYQCAGNAYHTQAALPGIRREFCAYRMDTLVVVLTEESNPGQNAMEIKNWH